MGLRIASFILAINLIFMAISTNPNVCLICLENTDIYAITKCNCRYNIHKQCLNDWLNLYNSCIICKSKINNSRFLRFDYLEKEFNNSKVLEFFDFIFDKIVILSNLINNIVIKTILFNIIFGCIMFLFFLPVLIYKTIMSQTKYTLDCANNNMYGLFVSFYRIKN